MEEEQIYRIRFWLGKEDFKETKLLTLECVDELLTRYDDEEAVISEALKLIYPPGCDRSEVSFEIIKQISDTQTEIIGPIFYKEDINVLDKHN
jgi:hypothetical protein